MSSSADPTTMTSREKILNIERKLLNLTRQTATDFEKTSADFEKTSTDFEKTSTNNFEKTSTNNFEKTSTNNFEKSPIFQQKDGDFSVRQLQPSTSFNDQEKTPTFILQRPKLPLFKRPQPPPFSIILPREKGAKKN
uniref:Uncharacterized protein n=1 Tax=Romanomermis culicivorax TaxID=13658 RepID=A0A915KJ37_ROMCU